MISAFLPTCPVTCLTSYSSNAHNMSDTVYFPRQLLLRFIHLYKRQQCLWNRSCPSYLIKQCRLDALDKLTKLVQEYDPTATRVHVLKKIDSLRTCVRREYRKVLASRQTATHEGEVYTPQLWYYERLSFIFSDEENELNSFKSKKPKKESSPDSPESLCSNQFIYHTQDEYEQDSDAEEDGDDDEEQPFESSMEHNYTEYNSSNLVDIPESSNKRYTSFEEEKSKRHCTEIEDEYDAIGINVAAKLRNLPPNTRILAEKLINDVLFQAQTNALTSATSISTPDPFK